MEVFQIAYLHTINIGACMISSGIIPFSYSFFNLQHFGGYFWAFDLLLSLKQIPKGHKVMSVARRRRDVGSVTSLTYLILT